jgi:GntR family transcriptional regulator/MocR family aminotransferase
MARQTGGALLSTLKIDRNTRMPLYRQLEDAIRQAILSGDISTGQRLPASRQLAKDLGISRLTVKNVYEQLVTENYLVSRAGAGTYVARIASSELLPTIKPPNQQGNKKLPLSSRANRINLSNAVIRLGGADPFRPGVPALDRFPRKTWASVYSKVMRHAHTNTLGYGQPGGLPELKRAIANHVRDHRSVRVDPQQIIITAGAQQAFSLIAFTLLNPGDIVFCEDPGHIAGRDAMRIFGADVRSVEIDSEGFNLDYAQSRHPPARLIFVTPSHQHPLGVTMSLQRRMQIIDYARHHDTWIVEDDYDSEFRYQGRALPAMQSLDSHGQILYVGSFSKTLFPALRLGYLIAPPSIVDAFSVGQTLLSQNISPVLQQTLARFIEDGSYNSHIRKMRTLYRERLEILADSLTARCGDIFHFDKPEAGMHLIAWLQDKARQDTELCKAIWDEGVDCLPVSMYCDQKKIDPGIMLGFACAPETEISKCVATLYKAVLN